MANTYEEIGEACTLATLADGVLIGEENITSAEIEEVKGVALEWIRCGDLAVEGCEDREEAVMAAIGGARIYLAADSLAAKIFGIARCGDDAPP